jgi:predicted thioesterase
MRTFTFLVHDDRYTVPTFALVSAVDEARAKILATEKLVESAHHTSVEVLDDDTSLFSVAR